MKESSKSSSSNVLVGWELLIAYHSKDFYSTATMETNNVKDSHVGSYLSLQKFFRRYLVEL